VCGLEILAVDGGVADYQLYFQLDSDYGTDVSDVTATVGGSSFAVVSSASPGDAGVTVTFSASTSDSATLSWTVNTSTGSSEEQVSLLP
jgi:hypothetical protein